jgi:hypothetical protein
MMELQAAFHYLCVDERTDEEWDCRSNLLNLHDCNSRMRLLEAREPSDPGEVAGLQVQAGELRNRLRANAHFQTQRNNGEGRGLKGQSTDS